MVLEDITNKTSRKGPELSEFQRGRICGLSIDAGWNHSQISRELGIPRQTIDNIVKAFKENGQTRPKPRSGRPPILTGRDERHLCYFVQKEAFEPMTVHRENLAQIVNKVSLTTLRKALAKHGFFSCKPALKPFLSHLHKRRRLAWVSERMDWGEEQWNKIIWSDESRFTLRHNDGGVRVIRKRGDRLRSKYVLPTFKFGKGSIMVWGCFYGGGLGPLVTLKGSVNQDAYVNCLSQKFLPWYNELKEKHGHDFTFQEDGASCHTGSYATWWKKQAGIDCFEYWPAQSPDLNPIETLWYHLGRRIAKKRAQANSLDELEALIHQEWLNLDESIWKNLVKKMPERLQAVKKARGSHTKF